MYIYFFLENYAIQNTQGKTFSSFIHKNPCIAHTFRTTIYPFEWFFFDYFFALSNILCFFFSFLPFSQIPHLWTFLKNNIGHFNFLSLTHLLFNSFSSMAKYKFDTLCDRFVPKLISKNCLKYSFETKLDYFVGLCLGVW